MQKVDNITQNQGLIVCTGTKVLLEVNGEEQEWEIVDVGESDVAKRKISVNAPLAKCLLGAEEGSRIYCKIMDNYFEVIVRKISLI